MDPDPDELEQNLAYRFRNRGLLERALTHKSRSFESAQGQAAGRGFPGVESPKNRAGEPPCENNEQLEFLGDAVLGFLVSEALVEFFPELPEGQLSKAKARFVNANHLYEAAQRLDLGRFLRLGRGEEMNGGRGKRALLADSMEAIIAAVYLDGGYEAARSLILNLVVGDLRSGTLEDPATSDFKGELQEYVQARKLPSPRYRVVDTKGPEHVKTFVVEVRVGEEWRAAAEGNSKKAAGQKAAEALLRSFRQVLPPGDPQADSDATCESS